MRIITISRQFGSGGRELGKRLADALGWDYYDREIVSAIAENHGLDERYVEKTLETRPWQNVTVSYSHSFAVSAIMEQPRTQLLAAQRKVIEEIAKKGRDCVIVGRNADVILAGYKPLRLFVCADRLSKLQRCVERAEAGEKLSPRQMEQNMRRIDKNRAQLHQFLSDSEWGDPEAYDLTVNTSGCEIKKLSEGLAELAKVWFEGRKPTDIK